MPKASFESIVDKYYEPLYRFALSLARNQSDAGDLTQQVFYLWATKGHQLRDASKVKTWLFTTLYRDFLGRKRRDTRFPNHAMEDVESELPHVDPQVVSASDAQMVAESLQEVDESQRTALSLFYIEQHSYKEIAEILEIPIGTVMSRLSRGKEMLRGIISRKITISDRKIVPFENREKNNQKKRGND